MLHDGGSAGNERRVENEKHGAEQGIANVKLGLFLGA